MLNVSVARFRTKALAATLTSSTELEWNQHLNDHSRQGSGERWRHGIANLASHFDLSAEETEVVREVTDQRRRDRSP